MLQEDRAAMLIGSPRAATGDATPATVDARLLSGLLLLLISP